MFRCSLLSHDFPLLSPCVGLWMTLSATVKRPTPGKLWARIHSLANISPVCLSGCGTMLYTQLMKITKPEKMKKVNAIKMIMM